MCLPHRGAVIIKFSALGLARRYGPLNPALGRGATLGPTWARQRAAKGWSEPKRPRKLQVTDGGVIPDDHGDAEEIGGALVG